MSTDVPEETFVARDPEFGSRVRESFDRQTLRATLGARLVRVAPGTVEIELPFSPALCQQHGYLHAGAITSVADSANGYAAATLVPAGTEVLAVEFKINLLEPAVAPRFVAAGRVLRSGRTLTVCLAHVHGVAGSERRLVATMLSTIIARPTGG